jgi:triosephosphate isomerase
MLIGFKTCLQATGRGALELARMAKEAGTRIGISIIPIPQFTDLAPIVAEVGVPVFAQHIDPIYPGSHTGHVLPEAVGQAGAAGTLINHSERTLGPSEIQVAVDRARQARLLSCVCSDGPELSATVARQHPDMILIENPELIGTGRAVSNADPSIITDTLDMVKRIDPSIRVICGAGITSGADVAAAMDLGVAGVGAASAIVKSTDPLGVIMEMGQAVRTGWRGDREPMSLR